MVSICNLGVDLRRMRTEWRWNKTHFMKEKVFFRNVFYIKVILTLGHSWHLFWTIRNQETQEMLPEIICNSTSKYYLGYVLLIERKFRQHANIIMIMLRRPVKEISKRVILNSKETGNQIYHKTNAV